MEGKGRKGKGRGERGGETVEMGGGGERESRTYSMLSIFQQRK